MARSKSRTTPAYEELVFSEGSWRKQQQQQLLQQLQRKQQQLYSGDLSMEDDLRTTKGDRKIEKLRNLLDAQPDDSTRDGDGKEGHREAFRGGRSFSVSGQGTVPVHGTVCARHEHITPRDRNKTGSDFEVKKHGHKHVVSHPRPSGHVSGAPRNVSDTKRSYQSPRTNVSGYQPPLASVSGDSQRIYQSPRSNVSKDSQRIYQSPRSNVSKDSHKGYQSPRTNVSGVQSSYQSPQKNVSKNSQKSYQSPKRNVSTSQKIYQSPKKNVSSDSQRIHQSLRSNVSKDTQRSYQSPKKNVSDFQLSLMKSPRNVSRIRIGEPSSGKVSVYEFLKNDDDDDDDHDDDDDDRNSSEVKKIEAPMLGGGEDDPSRRGPLEFITSMFKRRRDHDPHDDPRPPDITLREPEEMSETWTKEPMVGARSSDLEVTSSSEAVIGGSDTMASLESMTSSSENLIGGSAIMHHTPVKSRDIGIDMEAIRLSRQDNPYLQRVAGSQTTLNEDDDTGDCISASQPEDLAQLVTQSGVQQEPALSLSEVHEHLIRSPPPTSLPKTITKNMFVFPLSKAAEDDDALGAQMSNSVPCRTHSLNPLVARGHEDVLDQHLRQILNTQRQLVVSKGGRAGDSGGMTCSSVPGSPAHGRSLARRSPHARTLSEEAAVVQSVGGAHSMGGSPAVLGGADVVVDRGPANMGARPTYLGQGAGMINKGGVSSNTTAAAPPGLVANIGGGGGGVATVGGPSPLNSSNTPPSHSSGLAPLLPPGRRQHTPTDLLLNPANPPTNLAHPTITNHAHLPVAPAYRPTANSGTATPPILKPINTKTRRSPGMKSEGGLATTSSSLSLPIRYPHQPASSSALIDTT